MNDIIRPIAPRADAASGRFLLRLPTGLHAALRAAARSAGLSLNDYCLRRLAAPGPRLDLHQLAPAIQRAAEVAGAALVGVVAFGSWARGQAVVTSDIDLLVIVDPAFELTRSVYRQWDETPLVIDGRPVESHIVRLPPSEAAITAVWAEVAIDGIVLFERGLQVSSHLAHVRRAIVAERMARRVVHGQPYWHEVA